MYKLVKMPFQNVVTTVKRLSDDAFIPFAEGNTDYQAYLQWIAEGNTPQPAEEPQ